MRVVWRAAEVTGLAMLAPSHGGATDSEESAGKPRTKSQVSSGGLLTCYCRAARVAGKGSGPVNVAYPSSCCYKSADRSIAQTVLGGACRKPDTDECFCSR